MKRAVFLRSAGATLLTPQMLSLSSSSLSEKMDVIARGVPGRIGMYARTMAPGEPLIAYASADRFPTASLIKVLIMTTAYAMEEAAPGALSAKITFNSDDLIGGSDFMANAPHGAQFTVRELLAPMIQLSDNTAANLLIDHFGIGTINAVGSRAGMARTRLAHTFVDYTAATYHNQNVSTPADMGHLLYLIERGAREGVASIVSAQHCRAIVAIMLGQTDRDGIPAALPAGTQVANKTGEVEGTRNDMAIVEPYGDSPFILAVMTADAYDYPADYAAIHAVTRTAFAAAANSYA